MARGEAGHWPTVKEIASQTGADELTVRRVVDALELAGVVERIEPGDRIATGVLLGVASEAAPDVVEDAGVDASVRPDAGDTKD